MKKLQYGDRFGKLVVQEWVPERLAWRCICDCGNETFARAYSLKTGRHRSCRCGQLEERPHRQLPDNAGIKNSIMKNYRKAAARRNYSFELDKETFHSLIIKECYYCGAEPSMSWKHPKSIKRRSFLYNGVDRVNNEFGYTKENCVPCCDICNNSKSTLDLEIWKSWISRVYKKMFND